MVKLASVLLNLSISFLSIKLTSSQYPFSLNIPSVSKCSSCKFNWPTLSHYGYSFNIDTDPQGTTVDLDDLGLVTFSAISINYDSYNSSDSSCAFSSGFIESYNYQISIYHRSSDATSWTSKGSKSGHINREITRIDTISLSDITPSVVLTTGIWYIGLRLSWNILDQHCDC